MFGKRVQQRARHLAELVVQPLVRLGLTPNLLTLIGLLLNVVTATIIGLGYLRIGGALVLFAGLFDMLDGAMARVTDKKTTFGAFLDSTLDRYSEGIVLLGLVIYSMRQQQTAQNSWIVLLAYISVLGSLMVSYTRARAEGLGLECKIGLLARPERVLLLAWGLLTQLLLPMLAIMAVLVNFTAIQRIAHVWYIAGATRLHQHHVGSARPARSPLTLREDIDHDQPDQSALPERSRSTRR
jgi:CDP-diacylglycerol--glycerol-3-phosphate 3-phosphatidyltransferase